MKRFVIFISFLTFGIIFPSITYAGPFVAYSMKEAEKRLSDSGRGNSELIELGGITDLAGMVYDDKNKDLIIVGQINKGKPPITLDDLVVSMRAVFIYKKTPTVSIDKTPETITSKKQTVNYEGGIENTHLGKDMLDADILLKNLALGKKEVQKVDSYVSLKANQSQEGKDEEYIASRFWFKNMTPSLAVREGVFAIMDMRVGIETEVVYAEDKGVPLQELPGIRDKIGDEFARQAIENLSDISQDFPVLTRAMPILALVSLAKGMETLQMDVQLDYWLHDYKVPCVETLKYYDLIEENREINGRNMLLTVSGGFDTNPLVIKLKKGNVTALKEAVLNSRPSGNALIWHPPLEGWQIPGVEDIEYEQNASSSSRKNGFSLDSILSKKNANPLPQNKVTLNVTDFGINHWKPGLQTGDDLTHTNRVFSNIPKSGQILIAMPPDNEFNKMTKSQLTQSIYEKVKARVDGGLAVGTKNFELQLVQNINMGGYFDGNRQKMVNDFGECAYKAIGMIHNDLKSKNLDTYAYATVGSNGTKVFTENVTSWKSYMKGTSLYDGRAFKTPTIDTIKTLGEKNVHIFNTKGDLPALPPNPLLNSIANHDVTKSIKKEFPGINVTLLDPIDRDGLVHISGMSSDARFLAKDYIGGNSYTTPKQVAGGDFLFSNQQKLNTSFGEKSFNKPLPAIKSELPKFNIYNELPKQTISSNVGGVMLRDVAKVEGAEEARVDLMSGNFSLVVDGQNARLDPEVFRKFVTALWSVYYSSEDPGISIDPIAPKEKKHLVRYIGKVMNNDLGRVMREADYVMKKWSVGTERADVPGFLNPDDAANRRGTVNVGAWSRFWFVPENMKFKRGGDMLLFDDGRMTLKTEYMFMDDKNMHSDPSNEDFARFFTEHYNKIAEKYPVYKDLFEYAKLVSLAKYLKENGVPLYWFLMANKDLVITEDSPGTVDAFAKGSDYFKGVGIEGGVDLGFDVKQEGHYVYDQTAIDAINRAVSKHPTNTTSTSISANPSITKTGSEPFSFDLGKESYTVLPQHSLTSGKDRRGIRYQTDIALRGAGFRLTEEALGNIEYYVYRRELAKEINPIVESMDKQKLEAEYENIYKEKDKIATGRAEKVIEKLRGLKDQDFKAEDKFAIALEKTLGKEQFDQFKPLIFKHAYYKTNLEIVRYFNRNKQGVSEFGKGWRLLIPYQIKPYGDAKRELHNIMIPEKMAVENLITGEQEILTFSADQYTSAGYVPEKIEKSQVVGLFIMTDVSYRLADKLGNQFWFDPSGYLTDMIFSEQQRVHVDYLGEYTDSFDQPPYHVQPAGKERVKFLNVRVPKKIEVIDLVRGGSEELVFSDKGECAGYVPEDEGKSRYKILALMSNGAYQLVDKEKNEVKFSPTGDFEGMIVHSGYPIVKSVSQGGHKVGFTYTTDKSGKVFIAHAYLSENKEDAKPLYMVGYKYDVEGRLSGIKGEAKLAEASRTSGNEVR